MNGTDIELRKELWMWRAVIILLLLMNLTVLATTFFVDLRQHAKDNQERAYAWQRLYGNAERSRAMIGRNYDAIRQLEQSLNHCAECHAHPKGKE